MHDAYSRADFCSVFPRLAVTDNSTLKKAQDSVEQGVCI